MRTGGTAKLGIVFTALAAALGLLAASGACRKGGEEGPAVASNLPLQRVVLYRNGVGYFERAGKVGGDEIRFRVRESQVGDFLASLTVVTLDGKPVEFVTFPIKKAEEEDEEPEVDPAAVGAARLEAQRRDAEARAVLDGDVDPAREA